MNILLIEPPAVSRFGNQRIFGGNGSNKSDFKKPPLDLMMISGYLRKEGYDNELLDANTSRRTMDDVKNIIAKALPDIIFFSTSTCTIHKDLLIAKVAKGVKPSIITVALGTHVMALPEETLKIAPDLDVIIYSGEWEQAALNIVTNIRNLKAAKGIFLRSSNRDGNFIKTGPQAAITNLDELGFPSHDKLEKGLYQDPTSKGSAKTMIMGQKACINNCSFCCQPAFFGAPVLRKRSVAHFLKELEWVKELGFNEAMFNDATLTADKKWARDLFEGMIKNNLKLSWNCSTRADCVDSDVLSLMKRAGCHTVALGMESVDSGIIANIRKNISPEQIKKAVALIRKAGMNTIIFCVIGFPGETKETIKKTISFLKTLNTTFITLGIAVPVPGTDFYNYIKNNNYFLTDDWSLYDPMKKPVFSYPGLTSEDMIFYSKYGLRQFYLRPGYIWNRLCSIKNLRQLSSYFRNFLGFLDRYAMPAKIKEKEANV